MHLQHVKNFNFYINFTYSFVSHVVQNFPISFAVSFNILRKLASVLPFIDDILKAKTTQSTRQHAVDLVTKEFIENHLRSNILIPNLRFSDFVLHTKKLRISIRFLNRFYTNNSIVCLHSYVHWHFLSFLDLVQQRTPTINQKYKYEFSFYS